MIVIAEYDASWPVRFASESARIREVCAPAIIAFEHIGSTAVLPERLYFRDGPLGGHRDYHVHMVETSSDFWRRHLAFRDWLRTHPEDALAYEVLKRRLAAIHTDRNHYTDAKTEFISSIEARALG